MSRRILFTIALLLLPLAVMAADEPAVEAAKGPAKYVVVLKHPDEVPPGSPSEEPDFEKHGGRVSEKWSNRRVITIPEAALEALRKHPRIKYIQRVYTGEPIESDATAKSAPVFTPAVEAVAPTWYSGEYLYDGAGNVKRIGHNGPTGDPAHPVSTYNGDGKMNSYGYDTAGRLVQATANYGSDNSEQYEYDSFGNLTKRRTNGFETVVGIDPATNRVSDAVYDDAGNVESLGMHVYAYDGVSSMVKKVSGIQEAYIYSVDDERIGVYDAPTDTWRWTLRDFNGQVMREYESFGTNGTWLWVQDYVYRDGKLTAGEREAAMGGRRYYHLDHLGTTRLITDQSGQAFGIHDYFPFGNEVTSFRQEMINRGLDRPDPKRFTGHERDFGNIGRENTNYLDYMHARYYEPNWGRFLSVDPVFGVPTRPQSWNRYSYVLNSPLGNIDPTGRMATFSEEIWVLGGGGDPWNGEVVGSGSIRDFFHFISGASNAYATNAMLGVGRQDWGTDAYRNGQLLGDAASVVTGLGEMVAGATGEVAGIALDLTGVGAVVGIPVNVVSAGLIAHGGVTTAIGSWNLMSGIKDNGKRVGDLISGSLKSSSSYRSELENLTKGELDKLASQKGPLQRAAKQMKKLIESGDRLRAKIRGK
jgi:RHS repeat-associated protein